MVKMISFMLCLGFFFNHKFLSWLWVVKHHHWSEGQEIWTLLSTLLMYLFMGYFKSSGFSFLICNLLELHKEKSTTRGKRGDPGVTLTLTHNAMASSLHSSEQVPYRHSATVRTLSLHGRAPAVQRRHTPHFSHHHLKQKNPWYYNIARDTKPHPS